MKKTGGVNLTEGKRYHYIINESGDLKDTENKKTIVVKVDKERVELDKIRLAADIIKGGGLVAFPTETVYGLGADALNAEAVMKTFKAKMRPPDNPLIVHVAAKEEVYRLAMNVPNEADKLMNKFWPGPLTLVLKASEIVPKVTTAGLDTVAIRMPNHKVALSLVRESETPIVGPSANLAGKPSPTIAEHVLQDLAGKIDMILDAGSTEVGVESTVLDMTVHPPQILRPGGTTYEKLKGTLDQVELHPTVLPEREAPVTYPRSPGMKYRHYAPNAKLILVEGEPNAIKKKVRELANLYMKDGKRVGIMTTDENKSAYNAGVIRSLGSRRELTIIARNLFRILREIDEEKVDVIIAEGIPPKGLGLAVINRLKKASGFNIVKA